MKNQTFRMTMLLDFYGDVLTERQKEFFDLYYNEDLTAGRARRDRPRRGRHDRA